MWRPSREKTGDESALGWAVRRRAAPPSVATVQISPAQLNASVSPPGDSDKWRAKTTGSAGADATARNVAMTTRAARWAAECETLRSFGRFILTPYGGATSTRCGGFSTLMDYRPRPSRTCMLRGRPPNPKPVRKTQSANSALGGRIRAARRTNRSTIAAGPVPERGGYAH